MSTKDNQPSKQSVALAWIQKNPDKGWLDFCKITGNKHNLNSKDFSNGRYIFTSNKKKNLKKPPSQPHEERGFRTNEMRTFLRKNPEATYNEYIELTNFPLSNSLFHLERRKMKGINKVPKKYFKKSLITVINQLEIPENFGPKDEVLKWIDANLLKPLNESQSVFRTELVGSFYPENRIEFRLHTKRS